MLTRWIATSMVLTVLCAGSASAHERGVRHAYGRVLSVDPIIRYITVERPRRECRQELVRERDPRPLRTAGPTIAGGLIGGMIGHELGRGGGRETMTLLGTLVGSAVANEQALRHQTVQHAEPISVTHCRMVSERFTEQHIDGYRVTYLYRGRRYVMRTLEPPGDRVSVRMNLVPAGF